MKAVTLVSALERAMPVLLAEGVDASTIDACAARAQEQYTSTVWMHLARLLGPQPTHAESTDEEKTIERIWIATSARVKELFDEQTWNRRGWKETVAACESREDFLALFRTLGVSIEQWSKHAWMASISANPPEEGGIGFTLNGLVAEIHGDRRWKGYESFVGWMTESPQETMIARVQQCVTQDDFLKLFADIGIPEGKWRTGYWLAHKAKLPPEEGGIGRSMSGLKIALQERFRHYQAFVAWMDGEEYTETKPLTERLADCTDPMKVRAFFVECGVPDERWRELEWMIKGSRKPAEKGGIGKSFLGIVKAIYRDPRWKNSYKQFVAWMDYKRKPDTPIADRVRQCEKPEDYEALFDELGVPKDERFTTTWYYNTSMLPLEQGGIGQRLGHIIGYILEKFGTWKKFLAYMDKEKETPQWRETIAACVVREDFLELFASLGIPDRKWENSLWLNVTSALPTEEGGIARSLSGLRSGISRDPRFGGSYTKFVAWMQNADIDDQALLDRLETCVTPEAVRDFLEKDFGATPAQWQTLGWLQETAYLPKELGGIGRYGSSVYRVLCRRFPQKRYDKFLQWMGFTVPRKPTVGKNRTAILKRQDCERQILKDIANCTTPEDFTAYFDTIGIPKERHLDPQWMKQTSYMTEKNNGISMSLTPLVGAIEKDPRFMGSFKTFARFMQGEAPPVDVAQRFAACETREDYAALLRDMGIDGEEWHNGRAMGEALRGRGAPGGWTFMRLVRERFGTYKKFTRWMLDKSPDTYSSRTAKCLTPADFRVWFEELGIPADAWRTKYWFTNGAKESLENGGIGRSIAGVPMCILEDERFDGGWDAFVAWMDGIAPPPPTMRKRMADIHTREQYLTFFTSIGIPENKWRSSNWLERVAPLPQEKGGVGMSFQSVTKQLRKRFGSFPAFVAWMDKREALSPRQEIEKLKTPEDFLAFFKQCGVPGVLWRNSRWMTIQSIKPIKQGGIGRSMSGYYNLIRERFGIFKQFIAWMDGKDAPDPSLRARVATFKTPDEFLAHFAELGVPEERWRSSLWMGKQSMLPEDKGGIGKNLSGLASAIASDGRFNGYRAFVAWMDGKDTPDPTHREKIASLKTPADFLAYFEELGIPGDRWKKIWWMRSDAVLPPEEGGIGRSLSSISNTIVDDERFGRYGRFVEWMEGVPLNGIEDDTHASRLLLAEAAKFGVTVDTLLSTDHIGQFERQSFVVKAVIEFFRRKHQTE